VLESAFRRGGETVFVDDAHPGGISTVELERLSSSRRCSGRVLMNTEQSAHAMWHVAFLD
jgi:hypothetical protein